jgi:hypothetical protein
MYVRQNGEPIAIFAAWRGNTGAGLGLCSIRLRSSFAATLSSLEDRVAPNVVGIGWQYALPSAIVSVRVQARELA